MPKNSLSILQFLRLKDEQFMLVSKLKQLGDARSRQTFETLLNKNNLLQRFACAILLISIDWEATCMETVFFSLCIDLTELSLKWHSYVEPGRWSGAKLSESSVAILFSQMAFVLLHVVTVTFNMLHVQGPLR